MEKMLETLKNKMKENNFKKVSMEMSNGDIVTISPCSYINNPTDLSQIEYYLVKGRMPWMGGNSLEEVAKELVNYEENLKELELEKLELKDYFEKHIKDKPQTDDWYSDYQYYSDWHKDVYGFRPRGIVCGERAS